MATKAKSRTRKTVTKRFIGKPTGHVQERAQKCGPQHFGIVAVDCAKRRSKWLLCDFFGRVLIEPTTVEHQQFPASASTLIFAGLYEPFFDSTPRCSKEAVSGSPIDPFAA